MMYTETQTREAFLDSLKSEVLGPLTSLKVRPLENVLYAHNFLQL